MACTECKKKKQINEFEQTTKFVSNSVVVFAIIWGLLGFYGLYSFIKLFI